MSRTGMLARRAREATPHDTVSRDTAAGPPPATPARSQMVPGGPNPGWGTSSLFPGVVGPGTIVVNKDGTLDACNDKFQSGQLNWNVAPGK